MMKLTEFLAPENIYTGVHLSCKKRALELVGRLVAEYLNKQNDNENLDEEQAVSSADCFSNLCKREKLGSTGINHGVALPHAKLPDSVHLDLAQPIAIFLQLEQPIEYEAQDHKEVDLIYAVLFPESSCQQYKGGLQQIAQRLADKNLLKHLRMAQSAEEIWQVLDYADKQMAQSNEN